ncbi:MAG TPA: hydroxymethylpyrimidine/phosphomethylpyrimidine kinase [Planctomycetota bacterium]|jgi:hydroxymethylpyrimidine/phosphomethylpyrimidine kinase|nr:hydroxymethylpyrimidine/phosphomethylpyrimidine kinase [Planctomycetota bacterium]
MLRLDRRQKSLRVLLIGGLEPLSYSGLEADLRHLDALGCVGLPVVSAKTIQTQDRVLSIKPVDDEDFGRCLTSALEQSPDAIKIGMLHRGSLVRILAERIANAAIPVVLDPVLGSTSGTELLDEDGLKSVKEHLLPLASVVTPNWIEAQRITGCQDLDEIATSLLAMGARAVLIKGGHRDHAHVEDVLATEGGFRTFRGERVSGSVPRGTGCALASVIAVGLGRGLTLESALERAIAMVRAAIASCSQRGTRFLVLDAPVA